MTRTIRRTKVERETKNIVLGRYFFGSKSEIFREQ